MAIDQILAYIALGLAIGLMIRGRTPSSGGRDLAAHKTRSLRQKRALTHAQLRAELERSERRP